MGTSLAGIRNRWALPAHIAPLITFRVLFGLVMAGGIIRFYLKGWIEQLYFKPTYFFSYYGFEWVKPLGPTAMYFLFFLLLLSALGILLGCFYRLSAIIFFLIFTYIELIDKTNYLNHYYFVSLVSFLLIFLPANRYLSLDVFMGLVNEKLTIPRWQVDLLKIQLGIVYFFAGIAKINSDWLFEAMPLKIWLPSHSSLPVIGLWLEQEWTAYLFSWLGALFDLSIFFLLIIHKIRPYAYATLVGFHLMTGLLFPIGIFPFVMSGCTLIFFSGEWHQKLLRIFKSDKYTVPVEANYSFSLKLWFVVLFLLLQLGIPLRHILYPGHLFWTEEGYRFSWRVMLMEKSGHTTFLVTDAGEQKKEWVVNEEFLTAQQIKMMSTQPDMILQFAHHLFENYQKRGFEDPRIYCHSMVSLNGRLSRPFIDPKVNLAKEKWDLAHKTWILPYE